LEADIERLEAAVAHRPLAADLLDKHAAGGHLKFQLGSTPVQPGRVPCSSDTADRLPFHTSRTGIAPYLHRAGRFLELGDQHVFCGRTSTTRRTNECPTREAPARAGEQGILLRRFRVTASNAEARAANSVRGFQR
jgi:hypothetical protein